MEAWAAKYIGIPFVSGGRGFDGADCYGVIRLILANEFSLFLPLLLGNYTDALDSASTSPLFAHNIPLILGDRIATPVPGNLALIRIRGTLSHVGIYAGSGYILHTLGKTGSVLARTTSPALANRVEGFYRVSESYRAAQSVLD